MKNLKTEFQDYFEKLNMYVPIVDRVHGPHHPEFHDVRRVYTELVEKIEKDETDLNEKFKELREISDNYLVPGDVCETYEAVYHMLAEIDQAYSK